MRDLEMNENAVHDGPYDHVTRRMQSIEADRATENAPMAVAAGYMIIPRDESVVPQRLEKYRHPAFLDLTTSNEEVVAFDNLLYRLWEENEAHVGESTLEVQSMYVATGTADDLEEAFRLWFDRYLQLRAHLGLLNPQVRSDPCLLRLKAMSEVSQLVDPFTQILGTLNSVFLNLSIHYSRRYTLERLVAPYVVPSFDGVELTYFPADRNIALATLSEWFESTHVSRRFEMTSERLAVAIPLSDDKVTDDEIRKRLADLADDIQQMRPYLVGAQRPKSNVVRIAADLWVTWAYRIWCGGVFGAVVAAVTEEEAIHSAHTGRGEMVAGVNGQGILCNYRHPWEHLDRLNIPSVPCPLAVNYVVLKAVRDKLYESFDKIDLDRVRWRPKANAQAPEFSDEALDWSVLDLATDYLAPKGEEDRQAVCEPIHRSIPKLRFSRLRRVLERQLGCEVRYGRGSEIVVYRPGGRHFRLGRHKADFTVHPWIIRDLLCRLCISPTQWLDVVYG